jgi:peptidylprolyl isomerase
MLILAGLLLVASLPGRAVLAAEPSYRPVAPENLVLMELHEGLVTVELNPRFAPETVKQFRSLVQQGFYEALAFYRVIDGFVAQAGDGSDLGATSPVAPITAEFETDWADGLPYLLAQTPDLFAPETGFIDGFAVARDPDEGKVWLAHCPGVIAMARNEDPNSSRTDFYIVIGQAPRYLDRNMNVFGRVVAGMEAVQKIKRGKPSDNGIIEDDTARSRIRSVRLAADIPEEERPSVYVVDTSSEGFADLLDGRRNRKEDFFHQRPPRVLDVCQVPLPSLVTR